MALADWLTPGVALKALQVAAVGAIGVYTYRREMLNALGSFVAFAMGAAIVLFTSIFWLLLLFSLLGMASAATRFRYKDKAARKVAEKDKGRRRSRNVVANGLVPTLVAVSFPVAAGQWGVGPVVIGFVSAIAVAAADTLASELGGLSNRVYMITTFKRVPPGVDGGFSIPGQAAAIGGALLTTLIAFGLLGVVTGELPLTWHALWIPVVVGFAGCQIDSVLGATLESDGLLNKEEVNFSSIAAGAVLGAGLAYLVGI